MNVYQVYFSDKNSDEMCCVLAAAKDEQQAINMAIGHVKCFPTLDLENPQTRKFDITTPHVTIC